MHSLNPAEQPAALQSLNARPLWEGLRAVKSANASAAIWKYKELRPHLLHTIQAIAAKDAERRVVRLENPGLAGSGNITNALCSGLQVIAPHEVAPVHRHSQNALRLVIESDGAFTKVQGERVAMHPGDFILTPGWSWHEHGHEGSKPAIWLDVLDTPLARFFSASFFEKLPADTHEVSQSSGDTAARFGANLLPVEYCPTSRASPLLVYPYQQSREAIDHLARHTAPDPVHAIKMQYGNPISGGHVYPTIAAFIQMLPKGFVSQPYRSTEGAIFHVIEGSGRAHIGDSDFEFEGKDVFVVPPCASYSLEANDECVLFSCSDRAAQEALGFWREDKAVAQADAYCMSARKLLA